MHCMALVLFGAGFTAISSCIYSFYTIFSLFLSTYTYLLSPGPFEAGGFLLRCGVSLLDRPVDTSTLLSRDKKERKKRREKKKEDTLVCPRAWLLVMIKIRYHKHAVVLR